MHPESLGSSLFSVADVYPRLKAFAAQLGLSSRHGNRPLYFAKVDVSSCFDTIPQAKLLDVVGALLTSENYQVEQHVMVKAAPAAPGGGTSSGTPRFKFFAQGRAAGRGPADHEAGGGAAPPAAGAAAANVAGNNARVLVGPLSQQSLQRQQVLANLASHVRQNLVRMGKKYYVQRRGIPQGSIVSSLLVNLFYGQLEAEVLGWQQQQQQQESSTSQPRDYLLMRLIDDFLLVTTSRARAESFLQVLHRGVPEYGVVVKPEKSLANFSACVDGRPVPRCDAPTFPYCGLAIDVRSLEIRKEGVSNGAGGRTVGLAPAPAATDALTVEFSCVPGRSFKRKALNAFKIRMHRMFLDSAFNSLDVVAANLYAGFREAAMRMVSYLRCLPASKRPPTELIVGESHFHEFISWEVGLGTRQRQKHWPNRFGYTVTPY